MDIGFIGVGKMGGPMGRRLLDAGHRLAVCDVNPNACAELARRGAQIRSTPSQVAADCPNIITSLPSPTEVEIVMRELMDSCHLSGPGPWCSRRAPLDPR